MQKACFHLAKCAQMECKRYLMTMQNMPNEETKLLTLLNNLINFVEQSY